jgi:hypothetical protein
MKIAFWSLFALGFVLCSSLGIGPTLSRVGGNWTAPAMIAGSLLGVALLALAAMFGTGLHPPFLPTDIAMTSAIVVLIVAKVGVGATQAMVTAAARG